jgi:hypothetical protein
VTGLTLSLEFNAPGIGPVEELRMAERVGFELLAALKIHRLFILQQAKTGRKWGCSIW